MGGSGGGERANAVEALTTLSCIYGRRIIGIADSAADLREGKIIEAAYAVYGV